MFRLVKKRYSVFRSISATSNFDLIGYKDNKMVSFEVRTGYRNTNTGSVNFRKNTYDSAECYAVVIHSENNIIYYSSLDN
jgi:hypothetical protein